MKKLYFLLFLAFSSIANAQIINFPDANFKAKLLSSSPSNSIAKDLTGNYFKIDSNDDSEIQESEALNVKELYINNSGINSLAGIGNFINLVKLNANVNNIQNLDFESLPNISWIDCITNNATSINLNGLVKLGYLNCGSNLLTSIDFSQTPKLYRFHSGGCNFTSFDLNGLIYLDVFDCANNNVTALNNIDTCLNLRQLYISQNQISSIDLSALSKLEYFSGDQNPLSVLDFSNNPLFNTLYMNNTPSLSSIFIKNGKDESYLNFSGCDNLLYICSDDSQIGIIQNKINQYGYTNCHVNSYCSFTPGGAFYEVLGNIKFDNSQDGCDNLDIDYKNLFFNHLISGNLVGGYITNSTGNYSIPVQAGVHTITPVLENPMYFNISPANFTVDFPSQASPFTQDFCVTPSGVHSDVEIILIPTSVARPGFDSHYSIIYRNIGNQVENGEFTFKYSDDVLDYVSSSIVFDSQTFYGTETTLHWNYSNLLPFETRTIDVVLNVNSPTETPAVNNGDILGIFSEIYTTNTDEDLSNNSSSLRQVVVGSYDPNDKTCVEGESVDISMVGEYVHYVIRFENTGTYPAENIVVKDMIDISKFDITTLVPLHGSHEFFTRINDNKVEFIFENINLDFNDVTNDGYVVFKIKTLPTLTVGDTFSNEASIYFDYNFPIITNEYVTTIQNVLSNQDFVFENEFVLYPNPTRNILNISSKNQTEIQSVEIYNIVGQVIIAIPNSTKAIDVSSLETGTYFIKVNTEKGSTTTKFVKE